MQGGDDGLGWRRALELELQEDEAAGARAPVKRRQEVVMDTPDDTISAATSSQNSRARYLPVTEAVNHPAHYTSHPSGIECVDINERLMGNLAAAVKHLWRKDLKHPTPLEDLRKAEWYLKRELDRRSGDNHAFVFTVGRVVGADPGSLLSGVLTHLKDAVATHVEDDDPYGVLVGNALRLVQREIAIRSEA